MRFGLFSWLKNFDAVPRRVLSIGTDAVLAHEMVSFFFYSVIIGFVVNA